MTKAAKNKWPKPFRIIVIILLCFVGFVVFIEVWDKATRYINWKTLTKDELVKGAQTYIEKRIGVSASACLYVVDCSKGEARLRMVNDIPSWDLDADRDMIWKRRFTRTCQGRTTNIGISVIPEAEQPALYKSTSLAMWSFYNDRFIPTYGRFQSGSFSTNSYEQCTHEKAIVSVIVDKH